MYLINFEFLFQWKVSLLQDIGISEQQSSQYSMIWVCEDTRDVLDETLRTSHKDVTDKFSDVTGRLLIEKK